MLFVVGSFRLPAHRIAEARPAMERVIAASRAEPGCISYAYAQDIGDPELFRVSEEWESRAALDAHFQMPHMSRWREERESLGMSKREIRVITGGEAEDL